MKLNHGIPFLDDSEIERIAETFLEENWEEDFPVDVDELCDRLSIGVIYIPGLKKLLGIDAFITGDFKTIYADEDCADITKNDCRYRFTIAHELGHKVLHAKYYPTGLTDMKTYNDFMSDFESKRAELQANSFAGMILCPRVEILRFTKRYFGCSFDEALHRSNEDEMWNFLQAMCKRFGVSTQTAQIRLKNVFSGVLSDYWCRPI